MPLKNALTVGGRFTFLFFGALCSLLPSARPLGTVLDEVRLPAFTRVILDLTLAVTETLSPQALWVHDDLRGALVVRGGMLDEPDSVPLRSFFFVTLLLLGELPRRRLGLLRRSCPEAFDGMVLFPPPT